MKNTWLKRLGLPLALLSLVGLAVLALGRAMPNLMIFPDVDYTIFQYFGERMRAGLLPYRDIYDHKPPLIFYLNWLGLTLGNGSRWGIWALQYTAVASAALIGFNALRKVYGNYVGWLASAAFLVNLYFVHEGGNLTEEYALPFQFAALALLITMQARHKGGWYAFFIGVMIACASTLKQPLAGPVVAVGLIMLAERLYRREWRRMLDFVYLGLGFVAVWAAWFAWFAALGIFPEFWEAAFAYNFALSGITMQQRVLAILEGFNFLLSSANLYSLAFMAWAAALAYLLLHQENLSRSLFSRWSGLAGVLLGLALLYNGLFRSGLTPYTLADLSLYRWVQIALGAALAALGVLYFRGRWVKAAQAWRLRWQQAASTPLAPALAFAVIDLPVEILLSSLSGNNFRHYFMAALPSMTVLAGFFAWSLISFAGKNAKHVMPRVWAAALVLPLVITGALKTFDSTVYTRSPELGEVVDYVRAYTAPTDRVLQWGNFPLVNTAGQRITPSRYFFIDPLFLPGYTSRFHTDAFLADLKSNPPALIVNFLPYPQVLLYEYDAADCAKLGDPQYAQEKADQVVPKKTRTMTQATPISDYRRLFIPKPQIPEGMPEVYRWICENYDEETVLGDWPVLRYAPGRP